MKPNDTEHPNRAEWRDAASEANNPRPPPESDRIATLEAEKTDLKDKLLRTLADMENLRRRTEREVADARAYAVTNFARDMLNVADNVRRAIQSVPAEDARGGGGRVPGPDRRHRPDRARSPENARAPRREETQS